MGRLLCAIGAGAMVLLQSTVVLAAPSPSPTLDGILLSPPGSGFVEAKATAGIFEGPFDAAGYADITSTANTAAAKATLQRDGFLSGYGRTWVSQATHHLYVEAVMAFDGAKGAKAWLGQSEVADKAETTYQHPLTLTGVGSYYGARLVDTPNSIYADAYVFVKGNDTYLVSTVSTKDDLATTAATQAKRQYDSAPNFTIPPAQWPESKIAKAAVDVGKVVGVALVGLLVLVLIVGIFLFVVRRNRRPSLQAAAIMGAPAAVQAVPAPAVQMSEDRQFWWDGTTWRDAAHETPPSAQLSSDGAFWWDGVTWRPISSAQPPSS